MKRLIAAALLLSFALLSANPAVAITSAFSDGVPAGSAGQRAASIVMEAATTCVTGMIIGTVFMMIFPPSAAVSIPITLGGMCAGGALPGVLMEVDRQADSGTQTWPFDTYKPFTPPSVKYWQSTNFAGLSFGNYYMESVRESVRESVQPADPCEIYGWSSTACLEYQAVTIPAAVKAAERRAIDASRYPYALSEWRAVFNPPASIRRRAPYPRLVASPVFAPALARSLPTPKTMYPPALAGAPL